MSSYAKLRKPNHNPSQPPLVRGGASFPPDKGGLRGVGVKRSITRE